MYQSTAQDNAGMMEVEGFHLRYRIEGHGPPCLVVGSAICYPRVFSRELREHLRLVFVDLRHFAASADQSFSPGSITVDTYAGDIERVRQSLELGDVVVIGHSTHAKLALEYARQYPEHARGVVAIGGSPCGSGENLAAGVRLWEAEASEERKEILARQLAELTPEVRATLSPADMFVREYVAYGPTIWFDPTRDSSWLWEEVVPDVPIMDHISGELFKTYDLNQGHAQITVPVLIAQGRYDYGAPYTLWEEHRHKLPRPTYVLFEKSGHFPSLEEPQRFDQTLLAWVQALGSSTGDTC